MFKIEKIIRKEVNGKNGPFTRVVVKTGDKWASIIEKVGITDKWQEGDEVDGTIIESNGFFNIVLGEKTTPIKQLEKGITLEMIYNELLAIKGMIK